MQSGSWRDCALLVPLFTLFVAAVLGCERTGARKYKVQGKVTYPNGAPVTSGIVEFELVDRTPYKGRPVNATGEIAPDGTYYLSTEEDGDGAWPGKHRAIVLENPPDIQLGQRWQPAIAARFRSYGESGLAFDIEAKETNQIDIQVTRP
ncbi:MAG: hypothetical protein O2931_04575 [Planctomycetota bacterium]|nr:hypothetical protein [Planctomycetota bacterium]MDA1178055.1 hypothetical protein [Planctomycetota bacterium]